MRCPRKITAERLFIMRKIITDGLHSAENICGWVKKKLILVVGSMIQRLGKCVLFKRSLTYNCTAIVIATAATCNRHHCPSISNLDFAIIVTSSTLHLSRHHIIFLSLPSPPPSILRHHHLHLFLPLF